ncbi:MAG: 3-methylcrotonyl-CoA carboxylase alpha subunit [Gammaproteobacteria bacterium]|jgi:3-methylcrotonyl-CoA carboxylase alpha subunit
MFQKILIANRGEIALRIMRTAKRLGVGTVAVFSDADRYAPHVQFADEALHIGESAATQSYLDINKIIDAARQTNAEAIHPGYGFLSENADFAAACEQAGICFIGPSAAVIRTMGSKRDAKALMAEHGVPVVPGYFGDVTDKVLAQEAEKIGFPVLIKASAGGGGRGMRLVQKSSEFASSLESARREALAAFADDTVLLEKYIDRPRHIEVQIFGDTHGNVVHLFERDCSVQRRYQKLIEEAPAPGLSPEQRQHIHDAAVLAGKVAGYVGAGTVEFVVANTGEVFFIEMNTRLQVEHPVTEMITGEDLVAWQLDVAAGGQLPAQSEIKALGHAIELRLCAEDPGHNFAPSTGTISHLQLPSHDVRVDHGVAAGLSISPYYDSMIAKIITHGHDREATLRKAIAALSETEIAGVLTNGEFLKGILQHQDFVAGSVDTHFIERHQAQLLGEPQAPTDTALAAATLYTIASRAKLESTDGSSKSPWDANNSFRVNLNLHEILHVTASGVDYEVGIEHRGEQFVLDLPGGFTNCSIDSVTGPTIVMHFGSARVRANVVSNGTSLDVFVGGEHDAIEVIDPLLASQSGNAAGGSLTAPMPGTVLEIFVSVGDEIPAGAPIMLIEAMKIEHTIAAPYAGIVSEIRFKAGEQITAEGVALAVMEPTT